jgi:DNA polymerase (family 10)
MSTQNADIASLFEEMAELTELLGGNRFKVNAFSKVARVVRDLPRDAGAYSDAELVAMDGVGKGAVERIREFVDTGRITEHEQLAGEVPGGVLEVMAVPGIGPKTARLFWQEAGVTSIAELQAKLDTGELAELKGFGPKKLDNIRKSLTFAQSTGDRKRIGTAWTLARRFLDALEPLPAVTQAAYAGSLRRGRETIGDVDILVAADPQDAGGIFDVFCQHDAVEEVLLRGDTKASVRTDAGMQADLRIVEPASFGAALMYFTGSKEHNVVLRERARQRGMTLNEYALAKLNDEGGAGEPVATETEEDIYAALGLPWIPPELREDRGEIAGAEAGELPALIELGDVRSELHSHTTASDGKMSIRELAERAAARGFHTIAVTDHSRSQVQANGLDADRLRRHVDAIREVAAELAGTITVLTGSEGDILADGSLDYDDDVLALLDVVVASPHAALSQDPKKATDRLVRAIEHPAVNIIGHPTGRLVLRREGLHPDIETLAAAAAEHDVALEINANHWRLDLRDVHVRTALAAGARLAIDCDVHGEGDFDMLRYGVMTARRGGATAKDVVNCLGREDLLAWLGLSAD